MSTPPVPSLFATTRTEPAFGLGRAAVAGASRRASLGRGLTFVLLLTASLLASVYMPMALHGPDWVEGTAPVSPTATMQPPGAADVWAENALAPKPSRRPRVDPAPGTGLTGSRCAPRAEPDACRSSTTSSSAFWPA